MLLGNELLGEGGENRGSKVVRQATEHTLEKRK